jgi:hypothetical protein
LRTNQKFYPMNIEILIDQILRKMSRIGKVQARFFITLAKQWVRQRGRYCFDNLVRQGFMNAMSYRLNFDKGFNFKEFNKILIELYASSERIICFDPSFISKSGKHTYGLGYFWSGCAQSVKKWLEIGSLAIGDAVNNTAFHRAGGPVLRCTDGFERRAVANGILYKLVS